MPQQPDFEFVMERGEWAVDATLSVSKPRSQVLRINKKHVSRRGDNAPVQVGPHAISYFRFESVEEISELVDMLTLLRNNLSYEEKLLKEDNQ